MQSNETCENTSSGIVYAGGTFDNTSFTTKTFNTGSNSYTVPISGIYTITVYGAKGGKGADGEDSNYCSGGDGKAGAPGGVVSAQFYIAKGQTLTIYGGTAGSNGSVRPGGSGGSADGNAGAAGESNSWDGGGGGGGGGSSSVKIGTQTLVSAYGGGGGGGGEAGGSTIFCSSGYDGGSPNGSTGGSGSGSNASKGGDGGKGGNGGGSNYYYPTTTGTSFRYYGSQSTSGTNSGNGKIEIKLEKYAPCKSDCTGFDETNLVQIGKSISKCTGLAEHAHWNGSGEIEQTYYSGSGWLPSTDGGWGTSTSGCYFQCDSGYEWSDYYESGDWHCINVKTYVPCSPVPDVNGEYWGDTDDLRITQNYSGSTWSPSTSTVYSASPASNKCIYKCKDGYTYYNGQCVNTRTIACPALPNGAVYNTASSIPQSWTPSGGWTPANSLTYDPEHPSTVACHYKCDEEHYDWTGSECKAKSGIPKPCTGLPEENAAWNTASSIPQSWNGSEWVPSNVGVYDPDHPSTTECKYKCIADFHTENAGVTCVSNERDINCASLPQHAHWSSGGTGTKTIHQTWNGSWSPSTSINNNSSTAANQCYFQCDTNYTWNGSICEANKQYNQECTGLPDNAVWNTALSITQTWNGTTWAPSTTGSYNKTASTAECRFKCKVGYIWNGSQCQQGIFTWGFESDMPTSNNNVIQTGNIVNYWNGSSSSYSPGWTRITSLGSNMPSPKGTYSMCAANQNKDYTNAELTLKVNVLSSSGGTLSFDYAGYTEAGWDFLQVYVDPTSTDNAYQGHDCSRTDTEKVCTDGSYYSSWTTKEITLTQGEHTILFRYHKDTSSSSYADKYCIDNLVFVENDLGQANETINFESTAISTEYVTITGTGSYPWGRKTNAENGGMGTYSGSYAMCTSNPAIANSESTMTIKVFLPKKGTVSFYLRGSSESTSYDYLTVNIDGGQQLKTASVSSWTQYSYTLPAGEHTLDFKYVKDVNTDSGYDRYCIDDFKIVAN